MYAHPSMLDTYFSTTPVPAFVLAEDDRRSGRGKPLVSVGGLTATLERPAHAPKSEVSYVFPKDGNPGSVDKNSVINVRLRHLELVKPPRVVGKDAQGVNGTVIQAEAQASPPHGRRTLDNPEWPGTQGYAAVEIGVPTGTSRSLLADRNRRGLDMRKGRKGQGAKLNMAKEAASFRESAGSFTWGAWQNLSDAATEK